MPPAHPYLDKESAKIQKLFDGIAPRYDLLNRLLSFGVDVHWRNVAVKMLEPVSGPLLDACSGTGDLGFALEKATQRPVTFCDFSIEMLKRGMQKGEQRGVPAQRFVVGNTLKLPFEDECFGGAVVGFGIRNVENLESGLAELRRVLKPNAPLLLLEFTPVEIPVVKQLFNFYCHRLLPFVGNRLSRSPDRAYSYLQQSIDRWPRPQALAQILESVGYREVIHRRLAPGNVAIHRGIR